MDILKSSVVMFVKAAIDAGFQFPLYLAAVSVSGTLTFTRYTPTNGVDDSDGLKTEFLAKHEKNGGFVALPINVMLTDADGRAARMLIEEPEKEPEFFWPHTLPSD